MAKVAPPERRGARPVGPHVLHEPFGDVPEANVFGHQLHVEPNWLPTTVASRKLFIRQGFDRWDERPGQLRIERVDMADAVAWAGDFVTGLMTSWSEFPFTYGGVDSEHPNRFPVMDATAADGIRGPTAANMHWELGPDEALIVELDAHDGLWMVTNMRCGSDSTECAPGSRCDESSIRWSM